MSETNKREILLPELINVIGEQDETIENLTVINNKLINLLLNYITIEELEEVLM